MAENKPFGISKWRVLEAWRKVRANKGASGVDEVSIGQFEKKLKTNLYRVWNRMSSGTYMPPPVKRVMIPKADGKERPLGIPTVGDRVAQMVVKQELEPKVEPLFHPDSYGYKRPLLSIGTLSRDGTAESTTGSMGTTEIQAIATAQNADVGLAGGRRPRPTVPVCALGRWNRAVRRRE